jgi:Fe2+ or Zn2+ uptake regulation protein
MSDPRDDKARDMLQDARLYCTEARLAILKVLLQAAGPLRQDLGNRAWHFELANRCTEKQCHPHFTCTNCGVTHCLTDITLPLAQVSRKGFVISRQQVRLEGLCPACA